jgi:parallel beta-helix repeat protein
MLHVSLRKLVGLAAALALVALAAGHSGQFGLAQATCTVTVAAGSSIQAAINNAAAGAVFCVEAGEYLENLTISNRQDLTLQGAGRDVVTLDGSAGVADQKPAILIQNSQKITIKGFQIVKSRRGLHTIGSTGVVVADNRFDHNLRQSVVLLQQSEATLTGNLIENTQADQDGQMGQGVSLGDTSQVVLKENTISGSTLNGVILQTNARATIQRNTISDNNSCGVYVVGAAVATIEDNTINRNTAVGICASDTTDLTIAKNRIIDTRPDAQGKWGRGIQLLKNSRATIRDNTISGNAEIGVTLGQAVQATIQGNTITDNTGHGILVGYTDVANETTRAEIASNTVQNNRNCGIRADSDKDITITGQGNTIWGNANGQLCGDTSKFPTGFGGVASSSKPLIPAQPIQLAVPWSADEWAGRRFPQTYCQAPGTDCLSIGTNQGHPSSGLWGNVDFYTNYSAARGREGSAGGWEVRAAQSGIAKFLYDPTLHNNCGETYVSITDETSGIGTNYLHIHWPDGVKENDTRQVNVGDIIGYVRDANLPGHDPVPPGKARGILQCWGTVPHLHFHVSKKTDGQWPVADLRYVELDRQCVFCPGRIVSDSTNGGAQAGIAWAMPIIKQK